MKIYEYPSKKAEQRLNTIINRESGFSEENFRTVTHIIEDVKKKGDTALIFYTSRFDSCNIKVKNLLVTKDEIKEAKCLVDKDFMNSLDVAKDRIERFHLQQIEKSWINFEDEIITGQIVNPVNRVGIYVPGGQGGLTPLVSSVLMGAIPAKIAGVKNIVMVTPPTKDGTINPHLIAAADRVGVNSIFKVGGAWAIGALAYGTKTIPKVDVIVGPGNLYVTLAKKIVNGIVGIDMLAGPSEVLIIADNTTNYHFVAADLLSQAEHDKKASSIMITDSKNFAINVLKSLSNQLEKMPQKCIAAESIKSYGVIFVVENIEEAFHISNLIAPEHLELLIKEPFDYIGRIKNAGAIFIGNYTPEPVGDYIAGPNHVLPTAGTARFASGLSVSHFIKKTNLISYTKKTFSKDAEHIIKLAKAEGLLAHANSIKIRLGINGM